MIVLLISSVDQSFHFSGWYTSLYHLISLLVLPHHAISYHESSVKLVSFAAGSFYR